MPKFAVEARNADGKKVRAKVEAGSEQEAMSKIRSKGYEPLNATALEPAGGGDDLLDDSPAPDPEPSMPSGPAPAAKSQSVTVASKKKGGLFGGGRVSGKILTQVTTQMAILIDAGLPIVRSLKILENQQKPGPMKVAISQVAEDVQTGSTFSDALSKHPKVFDRLYVNMIRAGEAGGVLDTILKRLSEYLEKAQELKRKIIGASVYPIAVISIAVIILVGIMAFVVPQFVKIFEDFNQELPTPTKILIGLSNLAVDWWFMVPILPFVFMGFLKVWGGTEKGRYAIDKFKISMPLFGTMMRKAVVARFCRTLGTLIHSGVPILDALTIVKGATGNEVVARAINKVYDSIREGDTVAQPLSESGVFDDIVINMIAVGEETGELDRMLIKVADQYDSEVDTAVSGLMSILEPFLIIGMGLIIGGIVIALFLPLIELVKNLR
jgi:type IV pilus assembly protein PilC